MVGTILFLLFISLMVVHDYQQNNEALRQFEKVNDALDTLMLVGKTGRKMDMHFYVYNQVISKLKMGECDFHF